MHRSLHAWSCCSAITLRRRAEGELISGPWPAQEELLLSEYASRPVHSVQVYVCMYVCMNMPKRLCPFLFLLALLSPGTLPVCPGPAVAT